MDYSDIICDYSEFLREVHTDCCDYKIYRCNKTGEIFDEFHDKCCTCKYDTSKLKEQSSKEWLG